MVQKMADLKRIMELQDKVVNVADNLHAIAYNGHYYYVEYIEHLYDDEEIKLHLYKRQDTQNVKFTRTIIELAQIKDLQLYELKEL